MLQVHDISIWLDQFAPATLAEDWDNVGLLVGRRDASVKRLMTCLTVTEESAEEAVREQVDLIVTHHPFPFKPLKRMTSDTVEGRLVLKLVAAGVAVYSPHTAFDSARAGINQRLAEGLGLSEIAPLIETADDAAQGSGRNGVAPQSTLSQLADSAKRFLKIPQVQLVGDPNRSLRRVAVACGAAGEFLGPAHRKGCCCLITGETRFHTCLEAKALNVALILVGHYASERFAVEDLAEELSSQFKQLEVWASRDERDPLSWQ